MRFDPSISIGTIIQLIVLIGGILAAARRFERRQERIERKVNIMFTWFENVIMRGVIPNARDVSKFFGAGGERTGDED